MQDTLTFTPIAHIHSDFKEKFGIPRQSGRAPSLTAEIVFTEAYRNPDALRGIETFSHLWLLFDFSKAHRAEWSPTVRPPRLGGNERVGVFASRSPFRPNPIGLSCVRLLSVTEQKGKGTVLMVSGADLLDGTPILDIKPYIPYADCQPTATGSYADLHQADGLQVVCDERFLSLLPKEKRQGLLECLADDPRPSYQNDPDRVYGMAFGNSQIKFQVQDSILTVLSIQ